MFLIVGLGNPDKKYCRNYHNTGFMVLDKLAEELDFKIKKKECNGICAEYFLEGEKIIFAKPQTYMNLSGGCVQNFVNRYKIPLENILIVYDDIDIDLGALRFKEKGSAGTHNGMKNIVEVLGTTNIKRLRVGIGKPENPNMDLADYVISDVPKKHSELFDETLEKAASAVVDFINKKDLSEIMQKYN